MTLRFGELYIRHSHSSTFLPSLQFSFILELQKLTSNLLQISTRVGTCQFAHLGLGFRILPLGNDFQGARRRSSWDRG